MDTLVGLKVSDILPSQLSITITLAILAVIALEIAGLLRLKKLRIGKEKKKIQRGLVVLSALVLGVINGIVMRMIFTSSVDVAWGVNDALEWIDILQTFFLNGFEILIVPLIIISIVRAMMKAGSGAETSKSAVRVLTVLLVTVAIAAGIGYAMVALYPIQVDYGSIVPTRKEPTTLVQTVASLVPKNFFSALSANKALPIVFLSFLIGLACLAIQRDRPEIGQKLELAAEMGYEVVGTLVDFMIAYMPVGVLGIVTVNIATNDWGILKTYGWFILAFYTGVALIILVHLLLLTLFRVNLKEYFRRTGGTFLFSLTAMSSMAALPLTIRSMKELGVKDSTANLAGSLGTCVGQNACAGLYPAMIATIVGLGTEGVNVWTPQFAVTLILLTAVGSIGAAGVGGGNIQASLITLSLIGLDPSLITIFLGIDFFLSMIRPTINTAGSIVAGVVAQRIEDLRTQKKERKGALA